MPAPVNNPLFDHPNQRIQSRLPVILFLAVIPLAVVVYQLFQRDDGTPGGWNLTRYQEQILWGLAVSATVFLLFLILRYSNSQQLQRMTVTFVLTNFVFVIVIGVLYAQWLAHYGVYEHITPEKSGFFSFDKLMHFLGSFALALVLLVILDSNANQPKRVLYIVLVALVLMLGFEALSSQKLEILANPDEIVDTPRDLIVNGLGFLCGVLFWVLLKRKSYSKEIILFV